jgi:hypothetical protein
MNATITRTLPVRKAKKAAEIKFTAGVNAGTGLLEIVAARSTDEYLVVEFAADGGRGFRLAKVSAGTDTEADGYDVFCSRFGPRCECKGFLFAGHCKHGDAVAVLVREGQL